MSIVIVFFHNFVFPFLLFHCYAVDNSKCSLAKKGKNATNNNFPDFAIVI